MHCGTNIDANEVNTTANWMVGHQLPNGPMASGSPYIITVVTMKNAAFNRLWSRFKRGWIVTQPKPLA